MKKKLSSQFLNLIKLFLIIMILKDFDAWAYYGKNSTEAVLEFSGTIEIYHPANLQLAALNAKTIERSRVLKKISQQTMHLMGIFQSNSFKKAFGYYGTLGLESKTRFRMIEKKNSGVKRISYDFKGISVFDKKSFSNHKQISVPIILPLNPDTIYEAGKTSVQSKNYCTDLEFNEEDTFWYYWDPYQKGCPVTSSDLFLTKGRLTRINNTRISYPEYDRLYNDTLEISVLIGYIGNSIYKKNHSTRQTHKDDGYKTIKNISEFLTDSGFQITQSSEIDIDVERNFEKIISIAGKSTIIRVKTLLTDTDYETRKNHFYKFIYSALSKSQIFIYDGHSNLGKNFETEKLSGLHLDPTKYQILFFNGCSTYPYWNKTFFKAKGGSKNMEILTSALPAYALNSAPNIKSFLSHFINGKFHSYQKILSDLENSNGNLGTALTGVKGDHDNQWRPN